MKCKHCHAEIEQGAQYCPNCGKQLPSGNSKTLLKVLLGVLFIILLAGVGYYGVKQTVKSDIGDLNDSLTDTVGSDDAKKTVKSEYSFEDIVALMEYISGNLNDESKKTLLNKTGFELKYVYKLEYPDDPGSYYVYVGKDITVYPKRDEEVEIQPESDHACALRYWAGGSSSGNIRFRNKDDADDFLKQASEYGVYTTKDDTSSYFVPKVKFSDGGIKETSLDECVDNSRMIIDKKVEVYDGWYVIAVPMDY